MTTALQRVRSRLRTVKQRSREQARWLRTNSLPYLLTYSRLNNFVINFRLTPVDRQELRRLPNVVVGQIDITAQDYSRLLAQPSLTQFARFPAGYTKMLEYAASAKLLGLNADSILLDAAGGNGEYLRAVGSVFGCRQLFCNDLLQPPKVEDGVHYVGQGVELLDLADASLTAIACHHSLEHFRANADRGFFKEIVRLLAPGGKACIVPFFLAEQYAEIWNTSRSLKFDPDALTIHDPFATFTGWGDFEGFARIYSLEKFRERLLTLIPAGYSVSLHEVSFCGKPCPQIDLLTNYHQPRINRNMLALLIERAK
ncbi:MAG: hypothetical protein QOE70_6426 [Chthoniobacter sp.]|jgi:SAM-dependent methyltransferase|nr:hypothetical protein [Chthoniobacter sp.]